MKKSLLKKVAIIITLCIASCCIFSCYAQKQIEYYSEKENYVCVVGVVSKFQYNEDRTALYIDFTDLSPTLDDTCFKIVGDNLKIVKDNLIDDKVLEGKQVSFTTAPRYFGDGYILPIVAMYVDGECLLDFENGYKNLLKWLKEE